MVSRTIEWTIRRQDDSGVPGVGRAHGSGQERPQLPVSSINAAFESHARLVAEASAVLPDTLEQVCAELYDCFNRGNKLLACGNGGSAADAEHFAAELVGRYRDERRALPVVTLVSGCATVTAVANDYGYEMVFARQVEALARPGDCLIAISTSGTSANVVEAARSARRLGCRVIAFTGAAGGPLGTEADLLVAVPSTTAARIQEVHELCLHAVCESLDARLLTGAHE